MPDFQRWLLNAARSGRALPPDEFLWSPAKHFLFRKCRRAWFFRHYLAQGGWNEFSADPAMHAYLLKYLSTADAWTASAAEEALSGALLDIAALAGEDRSAELTRAFQLRVSSQLIRARDDLAGEEYLTDPKLTSFTELYYDNGEYGSVSDLLSVIQNRFADFFRLWEDSELPDELASVDPLDWRLPPEYRTFPYAGRQISLRPWIYCVRRKAVTAWTVRFAFHSGETLDYRTAEEEYGLPERVFAAWCAKKYPDFEVRVRKILFTPEGLFSRLILPTPVSEDFVILSAEAMLKEVNRPDGLRSENFPRLENPEDCGECRFRAVCAIEPAPAEKTEE